MKVLVKLKRRWQAYQRLKVGRKGESLACNFLQRQGFYIWKRNWRCRYGELDIIAYNGKILRCIEVKTRLSRSVESFPALDAIDKDKSRRLERLASTFVQRHRKSMRIRRLTSISIDAITVSRSDGSMKSPQILYFENIVDELSFNFEHKQSQNLGNVTYE